MNGMAKTVVVLAAITLALDVRAANDAEEKLAKNLAGLLVAGRAVVAQNQPLINDPAKGDKGFTVDAFANAVAAEFKAKSGIDLAALDGSSRDGKALKSLLEAQKQVIAEAQPTINLPGMGFKGFTPAIFGRQAATKFAAATGMSLKQTSEKYRNPANQPDAFEEKVLRKFAAAGWEHGKGYAEVAEKDGKKILRYAQPVYIAKPCLNCHGDPKGELDVSGRAKEGYREGELRGAISVVVPLAR